MMVYSVVHEHALPEAPRLVFSSVLEPPKMLVHNTSGVSQCSLTLYIEPNDSSVSSPTYQLEGISVFTYLLQSPMAVGLAL